MVDIKSPKERSINMSRIQSKGTKPEEYIRKKLYSLGFRYRKNSSLIVGHPDLWIARYNVAIFVNGCFWHRHKGCKYAYMPKSRVEFWKNKFNGNIKRDKKVRELLFEQGIRILTVWECTVKAMNRSPEIEEQYLDKIVDFINSSREYLEL